MYDARDPKGFSTLSPNPKINNQDIKVVRSQNVHLVSSKEFQLKRIQMSFVSRLTKCYAQTHAAFQIN